MSIFTYNLYSDFTSLCVPARTTWRSWGPLTEGNMRDNWPCGANLLVVSTPTPGSSFRLDSIQAHTVAWVGTYYPAKYNGADEQVRLLRGYEAMGNSCAHCAYHTALAACEPGEMPFVLWLAPGLEPGVFSQGWMPLIGELPDTDYTITTNKLPADYELPTGCGSCGLLGHTARTCEVEKVYDKIGIEIEGRFLNYRELQQRVESAGASVTTDGSIHGSATPGMAAREIRTRPGTLKDALRQVIQWYPDETDSSCGMHVHVSFSPTDLTLLCTKEFFSYFKERWTAWGTRHGLPQGGQFFKRLNGGNTYCRVNEHDEQAESDPSWVMSNMDRYHQLNFSSWDAHKTLECRLLPMFVNAHLAVSAIQELMSIYHDYLTREHSLTHYSVIDNGDLPMSEEHISEIDTDLMQALAESLLEHELEYEEPPPVPEGMRRVALSPLQLATYQSLFGAELEAA